MVDSRFLLDGFLDLVEGLIWGMVRSRSRIRRSLYLINHVHPAQNVRKQKGMLASIYHPFG
ncbi:hypothetical protein LPTSP4_08150 [Leptospira ryugenii]|uniref:Uncharacterized protein n=1 Tax=Leptospira ryugenii TaxID=1917863 RepID=A0A2P2DXE5_9LEPT|nr:hypothetical protein [Leptospira ryugenii]GBF49304.1 hypothetical protein LPTSP4_08150 [Leptospira ryugenii]